MIGVLKESNGSVPMGKIFSNETLAHIWRAYQSYAKEISLSHRLVDFTCAFPQHFGVVPQSGGESTVFLVETMPVDDSMASSITNRFTSWSSNSIPSLQRHFPVKTLRTLEPSV